MRGSLLVVALAFGGCGGTVVFDEPGGGGATGGTGSTPTTVATTAGGTTGQGGEGAGADASASAASGPSDGICLSGVVLFDGSRDACLEQTCCDAFEACATNDEGSCTACIDDGGTEPPCDEAVACAIRSGCFQAPGDCSTGLSFGDSETDDCIQAACCVEGLLCIRGGEDVAGCADCLQAGGGPRCLALLECGVQAGCIPADGICTSGLTTGDVSEDACLTVNCCDDFVQCTSFGQDTESCIQCLESGGGPLCDAAIACNDRFGCTDAI
jgi:hypothetical protein